MRQHSRDRSAAGRSRYAQNTPQKFIATGKSGNVGRWHSATLLHSGKVAVAGGALDDDDGAGLASPSLYDPGTGKYIATGNMTEARLTHTATLLPDGKVFIAGGSSSVVGASLAGAESTTR